MIKGIIIVRFGGLGIFSMCVLAFFMYTFNSALKSKKRNSQYSTETEPVWLLLKAQKRGNKFKQTLKLIKWFNYLSVESRGFTTNSPLFLLAILAPLY